ncbi:hypothetical protein DPEC_G00086740 [Dallia pectoralis]|uniref:Uncharacterized protein n=1 Tax=Dallia pectoralis TaxID=75939 RepID=A0ACC2H0I1_DALPE|nr:hypothetical protein DPEC_G00086740 [Dallia pectoralis]
MVVPSAVDHLNYWIFLFASSYKHCILHHRRISDDGQTQEENRWPVISSAPMVQAVPTSYEVLCNMSAVTSANTDASANKPNDNARGSEAFNLMGKLAVDV